MILIRVPRTPPKALTPRRRQTESQDISYNGLEFALSNYAGQGAMRDYGPYNYKAVSPVNVTPVYTKYGPATRFDTGGYLTLDRIPPFYPGYPWTLAATITYIDFPVQYANIFGNFGFDSGVNGGFNFYYDSTNHIFGCMFGQPSAYMSVTAYYTAPTGSTFRLVYTYDGAATTSSGQIYYEGIALATTSALIGPFTTSTSYYQPNAPWIGNWPYEQLNHGEIELLTYWSTRKLNWREVRDDRSDPAWMCRHRRPRIVVLWPPVAIAPTTIAGTVVSAPSVTRGAVIVSPSTVTETLATHAPSVVRGAVIVSPSTVTATSVAHAPSIALGAQIVSPATVVATSVAHAPSVTLGAQQVSPSTVTVTAATHSPSVISGATVISPTTVTATSSAYNPSVVFGGLRATPQTISGTLLFGPNIVYVAQLAPISIGPDSHIFSPTIRSYRTIAPDGIGEGTLLFPPDVLTGGLSLSIPSILSTVRVNPMSIFGARQGPTDYSSIIYHRSGVMEYEYSSIEPTSGKPDYQYSTIETLSGVADPHRSTKENL